MPSHLRQFRDWTKKGGYNKVIPLEFDKWLNLQISHRISQSQVTMMYVMRVFISIQSLKYPTNLKKVLIL